MQIIYVTSLWGPSPMWHPLKFDSKALLARTKDVRQFKLSMESLILAQDERWRRA